MKRSAELERKTAETQISAKLILEGSGGHEINTGIGFFDHMLTLLSVHSQIDLVIAAQGDIAVDYHHTVEDVGLVIGELLNKALGARKAICRYGHAVIPMDDALAEVTVDLSNRPYLKVLLPENMPRQNDFDISLAKEFFRSFACKGGLNLHIQIVYGDNWHHMIEAVFKGVGRAIRQAIAFDHGITGVPSSKGSL